MAELKTTQNDASVDEFLNAVEDEKKRQDSFTILKLMKDITGFEPKMWGPSIVGFGKVHYKYATGHEGDMGLVGFSPRKQALTIYIVPGFKRYPDLMSRLGKYKTGKVCLYIKSLKDVDIEILKELIHESVQFTKSQFPTEG